MNCSARTALLGPTAIDRGAASLHDCYSRPDTVEHGSTNVICERSAQRKYSARISVNCATAILYQ